MKTIAYRGYLIHFSPLSGQFRVEKDGFHICWAMSKEEARACIDQIA